MRADSNLANQAVRDRAKYKPDMVRNIEKFNKAVAHFRRNGQDWPKSEIYGTRKIALYNMTSYDQFEAWLFQTEPMYRGLETLPART